MMTFRLPRFLIVVDMLQKLSNIQSLISSMLLDLLCTWNAPLRLSDPLV